jgi:hypothetical protein
MYTADSDTHSGTKKENTHLHFHGNTFNTVYY